MALTTDLGSASPSPLLDPVFGDPRRLPEIRANRVRGLIVKLRGWYLREFYGAVALEAIAASLPEEARRHLLVPGPALAWLSMGTLLDIDRAIVERTMDGDVRRMKMMGLRIAEHNLASVFKAFMRLGTPGFLLGCLGKAVSLYFEGTSMRTDSLAHGEAHLTLTGRPMPLYLCAHGYNGFIEEAVKTCGGQRVTVEHVACVHRQDAACEWRVRWS